MESSSPHWPADQATDAHRWRSSSRHHSDGPPSSLWSQLSAFGERLRGRRERTSAEVTTQFEASPGRGHALRNAHRTLARHMQNYPALRQVTPHLAVLERAMGKRGSRALLRLPLPVLRRSLEQLTMLQRDDDSPEDTASLRVLRLRLMEAIALRTAREQARAAADAPHSDAPAANGHDASDPLRGDGLEVRQISVEEFIRARDLADRAPPRAG